MNQKLDRIPTRQIPGRIVLGVAGTRMALLPHATGIEQKKGIEPFIITIS